MALALIAAGADTSTMSNEDRDALQHDAVAAPSSEGLELLFAHGLVSAYDQAILYAEAVRGGRTAALPVFLAHGADATEGLRAAVDAGSLASTNALLAAGADPNGVGAHPTVRTYSPLLRATFDERADLVDALLAGGADPNEGGSMTKDPFDLAIAGLSQRHARFELPPTPNLSSQFPGSLPPLVAAAATGNGEIVVKLLTAGADVNRVGLEAYTPLHAAVLSGNVDTVRLVLAAGADPTPTTPLATATPHDLASFLGGRIEMTAVLADAER